MSRSGYTDDYDNDWSLICWRGQVASAIRGKRGQAFLRDLIEALDAMPEKKLIADNLVSDGGVCAIGAVAVKRGIGPDVAALDTEDDNHRYSLARMFNIAHQLVSEIEWMNDDAGWHDTSEQRWSRMRRWAQSNLRPSAEQSPDP